MEEGVWWLRSDSAACWEPQNLLLEAGPGRGEGGAKTLLLAATAHPGWVKLEGKSCSVSQINDEFSERSNAVL